MTRRLALVAAGAVLTAATAAPALASKAPACPTFTDPKGDAAPVNDATLDITSVTYGTVGKELVASMTVDKLAARPNLAAGARFQFDFTLNGHAVTLYYKSSPTRDQEANAFYQQGYRVDDVFISDAVTGTIKENTVTIAISYGTLKGDLGPVLGKPLSGLTASTLNSYVATNEEADKASGPMTYAAGSACS